MRGRWYIRPVGLVPRPAAGYAPDRPLPAEPLCGPGGFYDFTAVELICPRAEGLERSLIETGGPQGFAGQDWHHPPYDGERLWRAFDRLIAPRPPVAGLSLARPRIMGVVNVTPDSFSDGGRLADSDAAIAHGLALAEAGADILDIGGESTRPGSDPTPLAVELDRVLPVIAGLKGRTRARISIDTRKAEVMRRALAAGADILNDVTALGFDPEAMAVAAASGAPVVLMHALGDPKTMQVDPRYDDVLTDVYDYLETRIEACETAGIARSRLVVDPGIGFGKTFDHNLELLAGLTIFHGLGCAVLLGASRKRFIGTITAEPVAGRRVLGSVGAALAGLAAGVQIVRVHDVAETRAAMDVWLAAITGRHERGCSAAS